MNDVADRLAVEAVRVIAGSRMAGGGQRDTAIADSEPTRRSGR